MKLPLGKFYIAAWPEQDYPWHSNYVQRPFYFGVESFRAEDLVTLLGGTAELLLLLLLGGDIKFPCCSALANIIARHLIVTKSSVSKKIFLFLNTIGNR
jgi:hypothetical protein